MPSNNAKYVEEFPISIALCFIENLLPASSAAEGMRIDTKLVNAARGNAIASYGVENGHGFHSDRGAQSAQERTDLQKEI